MSEVTIKCVSSIRDALTKLELNRKKFLVCLDGLNRVSGVVTDGDIRRSLLSGLTLSEKIDKVCNDTFRYLNTNSSFDKVCELFRLDGVDFLPIINKDKRLVNILTKKQFHVMLLQGAQFDLNYDFTKFDYISLEHEIYNRPWGFYKSTVLLPYSQAKILTIFPHSELSLQKHKKREEHWVIVKGEGKVVLGESLLDVYPGRYIYIPKGCKHQIINDSDKNIILSEVQLGDYFGEDDIVRYSDKYGRN